VGGSSSSKNLEKVKTDSQNVMQRLWLFLGSESCTGLLVILLSLVVLVAIIVPQGQEALDIAVSSQASMLHTAARWGFTEIYRSAWVQALGVLFVANVFAMLFDTFLAQRHRVETSLEAPASSPLQAELRAKFPEKTMQHVRGAFSSVFGLPESEQIKDDQSLIVYHSARDFHWRSIISHFGLAAVLLGVGMYSVSFDPTTVSPRAILKVTDPISGSSGVFNLRAGESRKFFSYPDQYFVRSYKRAKDDLGPAVLIEKRRQKAERGESFWIYLNAPEGFDRRHRQGQVDIKAIKLGRTPLPGVGLINSPVILLILGGIASILVGLRRSRESGGTVWISFRKRTLKLAARPKVRGDRRFIQDFDLCVEYLRKNIE